VEFSFSTQTFDNILRKAESQRCEIEKVDIPTLGLGVRLLPLRSAECDTLQKISATAEQYCIILFPNGKLGNETSAGFIRQKRGKKVPSFIK
jgi:hypothetical protein